MSDLPTFDASFAPKFTASPNPAWKSPQPISESTHGQEWLDGEKEGWQVINAATENPWKLYGLMISGIVPRPIAFVSTISADGHENLAPFSWFNQVSASPPIISISCANVPKTKDTPRNIRETKEFTVNIISEAFIEGANGTSIDAPPEFNEWEASGLTRAPGVEVKPALVKESAFSMECELYDTIEIKHPANGAVTAILILGLVKHIHVRKDVLAADGTVDPVRFKPVARLGDITYGRIGDMFRIPRPPYVKPEEAK
ncbi:hypothetical protein OF83DRAFT_1170494 [Amylostereum chailletii]|nr:hypothetical protein OF83DRAFT_1170494 [Amylostereum chailletii]